MTILTPSAIRSYAATAGFTDDPAAPDLTIAVAVALAESGGRTDAINHNTNGSTDYGVWQINTVHEQLLAEHQPWNDPTNSAAMAFQVFRDAGYRWTPWSTFNSGRYKAFWTAAQQSIGHGQWLTVNPGDTLSHIAQVQLHDAKLWPLIWHAPQNAGLVHLRTLPERIEPGDRLFIPLP